MRESRASELIAVFRVHSPLEGRIYIELINGPFLGTPDEYKSGFDLAIERGWLFCH